MSNYSYQIKDKFLVTFQGQIIGEVNPSRVPLFLNLFKGGKGRWGAWSPFVEFYPKGGNI